ncbi:C39 family peptidase [Streptomyces sp. NPDC090025]|uniref:C39 family peptidase n=1 Tax=Streptomyces sp. NPDC090025 TaxID=3365922 RepID=UPI003833078C
MHSLARAITTAGTGALLTGTVLTGAAVAADRPSPGADTAPVGAAAFERARAESAAKDAELGIGEARSAKAYPERDYLERTFQAQKYNNYCGPATAHMTIKQRNIDVSQETLAKRFGITPGNGGTSWDDMLSALRHYTQRNYAGEFLAYSPSAQDKARYKERLKADINETKDGIAGNVWEVVNGPHLPGHPNKEIFHWINIRGYKEHGKYTQIQDPATSVWKDVPGHAPVDSDKLVTMMGGRGYQW